MTVSERAYILKLGCNVSKTHLMSFYCAGNRRVDVILHHSSLRCHVGIRFGQHFGSKRNSEIEHESQKN